MEYKKLGNSDLNVSVIALGTWGLGGGSVWSDKDSNAEEAARLLDACLDHGINYIDTAPVYGTGASEELLGAALKGRRHDFILQTKCSLNWRGEGGNFHYSRDGYTVNNDTRPAAIRRDVEDSLRRMGTDYIDVLIVHYVCKSFPVSETVGVLEDLIREGKIRAYGLSNSQPADLEEYQSAPEKKQGGIDNPAAPPAGNLHPFVTVGQCSRPRDTGQCPDRRTGWGHRGGLCSHSQPSSQLSWAQGFARITLGVSPRKNSSSCLDLQHISVWRGCSF